MFDILGFRPVSTGADGPIFIIGGNTRMQEIQLIRERLSADFLDAYLRFQKLNEEIDHSAGTIVWKGPKKQYPYWQFYDHGKQIQKYIHKSGLEVVRQLIEKRKAQFRKRSILRGFISDMKGALRAIRVNWQEVIAKYEEAQKRRETEAAARAAAKKVAENKRYADQYKHLTDKGDYVASKSEMMIANKLYSLGIHYEYEKEVVIGNVHFRPDFTIFTKDGRIFYWEHAGMMDEPEYRRRHDDKMDFYERNGIRLQENLIVTKDHDGAISMDEIRRTIDFYRLQE